MISLNLIWSSGKIVEMLFAPEEQLDQFLVGNPENKLKKKKDEKKTASYILSNIRSDYSDVLTAIK